MSYVIQSPQGIGNYIGEIQPGPDGNLYQWVEGVDGLGNPFGFWKAIKRGVKKVATGARKFLRSPAGQFIAQQAMQALPPQYQIPARIAHSALVGGRKQALQAAVQALPQQYRSYAQRAIPIAQQVASGRYGQALRTATSSLPPQYRRYAQRALPFAHQVAAGRYGRALRTAAASLPPRYRSYAQRAIPLAQQFATGQYGPALRTAPASLPSQYRSYGRNGARHAASMAARSIPRRSRADVRAYARRSLRRLRRGY